MNLDELIAIEEIKQLKARYFRLMDAKDWASWRELFTDDCYLRWGPGADDHVRGGDALVEFVSGRVGKLAGMTVHHGHMPEIDVTGPTTATGTWALFDYLDVSFAGGGSSPMGHRMGYGRYFEEYRRDDGRWRISSITLVFTRMDDLSRDAVAGEHRGVR